MANPQRSQLIEQIQLLASKIPSSSSKESAHLAREILLAVRQLSARSAIPDAVAADIILEDSDQEGNLGPISAA